MTIKKVIQLLREQGHSVDFYTRKDGGLRITNIDGLKFSSKYSEGNAYAQQLAGQPITKKAYEQRIKAGQSAKELKQTSKEFQAFFKKAQKEARTGRTPRKITWRDTKETYKKTGEKGARAIIEDIVRHAQGKAYKQHWQTVYQYLDDHPEITEYKELLEPLEEKIPVETVDKLIYDLYAYDKGAMSLDEIKRVMDSILKTPQEIRSKRPKKEEPKYVKPFKPRFHGEKESEGLRYETPEKKGE